MKATAPEKIYINGFSCFAEEPVKEGVEYIRTDVFIEKACEWLESVLRNYAGYYVGNDILRDFKNYIIEEKE